ncbi:MAG: hypothetical protein KF691_14185 [Phycisphaeraceae bacterium]|nr:hypothetical protein [Phycisphaeraceae bacterium]
MRNFATSTLLLSLVVAAGLCAAAESAPGPQRGTGNWINPQDAADLDFDGYVDDADFILFSLQYDAMECDSAGMLEECSADLNHDGQVDDADFVLFVHEYNRPIPVLS